MVSGRRFGAQYPRMNTSTLTYPLPAGGDASLPDVARYEVSDADRLLTPALLIYPELVEHNIRTVVRLLDGNANRWRAHVKSAKLASVMHQLVSAGVSCVKCATTLELRVACEAGATDALLAYPLAGRKVARVQQIAREFPRVRVSALVESTEAVGAWTGSHVALFVDVNPGMDRTGVPDREISRIVEVARTIVARGIEFGGIHYYDGHLAHVHGGDAERVAHAGYDRLLALVAAVEAAGIGVPEIITAGTPAFPLSLTYAGFTRAHPVHRVSPGTIVYGDATSAGQLPAEWGLLPAAVVAATVVSHPTPDRVTCDAGHKTVSADAGVPTCLVLGHPDFTPLKPSEEHLPVAVPDGAPIPRAGEILYLVPRHVCPTVNNFDKAVIVREGRIAEIEAVAARGREGPLAD